MNSQRDKEDEKMMWKEFEEIAGYEVSYEDYSKIIEPMYMAVDVDKATFCKMLDKKAFALPTRRELVTKMKKLAHRLAETCEHFTDYATKEELERVLNAYGKQFYHIDPCKWATGGWHTTSGYTFPNGRGCSFPREVTFYGGDYKTLEVVPLVTDIGYKL